MTDQSSAGHFWAEVQDVLGQRLPRNDVVSWFSTARAVDLGPERLTLAFANDFAVRFVADRFRSVLEDAVADVAGARLEVVLVADAHAHARESIEADEREAEDVSGSPAGVAITEEELRREVGATETVVATSDPEDEAAPRGLRTTLNPRLRFDTFVIGEGNKITHAAALSVAENPGMHYNPLFVYGATGLGKTHLLHAIGHYAMATQPGTTVAYVTTEGFINLFIQALQRRDDSRERFKAYFRGVDILLVDDVQFLSGKGATLQEEFFHTFNALYDSGRQIVLTSDCKPGNIPQLESRIASRFSMGLVTDIERPDRETRIAILRKKANIDRLDVADDVVELIGERITTNVRELEGALTRVIGYGSLTGRVVDVPLAEQVLGGYLAQAQAGPVTIDRIQEVVCSHFGISHDDLVGQRRSNDVTLPRQIAMYLAREMLNAPSTHVGRQFGGRDHTTVIHAQRKIDDLIRKDAEIYDVVERLTATIRHGVVEPSRA